MRTDGDAGNPDNVTAPPADAPRRSDSTLAHRGSVGDNSKEALVCEAGICFIVHTS